MRSAAMKQANSQRNLIDQALLARRRKEAHSRLGEEVYGRMLAGELDELARSPAIASIALEIAELDQAVAEADTAAEDAPADWSKSRARHGARRPARVWRPGEGDAPSASEPGHDAEAAEPAPRRRRRRAAPGQQRGGIAFVRDEDGSEADDLADYMHDDDVPDERES